VPAPPLASPNHVYLLQLVITSGLNQTRGVVALPSPARAPLERQPITLKYSPPSSGRQTAEMVSIGGFRIRDREVNEFSLSTNFRTTFTEQFADAEPRYFPVHLAYDRFSLSVTIDDKPIRTSADLRKGDERRALPGRECRDGERRLRFQRQARPRTVPSASRAMLSDIRDQMLESLDVLSVPLPDSKIEALQTGKAQRNLLIGSSVIAVPAQAHLIYKYLGVQPRDGKTVALVTIEGHVKGRRGDGLNAGGTVSGLA
jgi:hypothetical protein